MTNQLVKIWAEKLRDLAYDVEDILNEFDFEAQRRKLEAGARKQKNHLDLRVIAGERSSRVRERRPTTSVVNKEEVCGREEDKKAILEFLNAKSSEAGVSVISIIGMGGLGKTTLAQLVFNEAKMNFDLAAWVLVGDDFDVFRITRTIFLWFGGHYDGEDLNFLQENLKERLLEKKFFIVLDDVWNEKYGDWTLFHGPFQHGAKGSRIVVTTRSERVSRMMGCVHSYTLKQLSYDGCLSILAQHALGATNFDEHLDLKAIGEKIARRCQGLPLAAQAIGGVLRDYQFDENELVLQWMAEGFLQQQQELKQMEALGHEYFQDLLLRSFFQPSTSNKSQYVMHDLINDLAQSVSGEVCFNLDDKSKSINSYSKVRHSAFICYPYDISQRFEVFKEMNSLRTFLPLPKHWGNCLASNVVHESVPTLKRLRVLSLSGYQFEELPSSIGDLKHLRYLDLYRTDIHRLPNSLSNLWNLQTLKLRGCYNLTELHAGIGNLINLMHIDLIGTDSLVKMPREMANLTNLQTLSKFIVGKGNGLGIKELMKFPNLGGQLQIEGLHNVVNIQDAELADLKKDEGLDELALVWSDNFQNSRSDEDELLLLSFLQPHQKLRKLSVEFYGGKKFPSWIGDPSFTNMVDVELCSCPNIISLPPLGLLSKLRNLRIEGMGGVAEVSVEFYGHNSSSLQPFPSLETLEIQNMLELKHWACSDGRNEEAAGNFPKLHELTIINCPKLDGKLPRCLPSLKN
ncbi:hypothetical protein GH714_004100 [Hevea brasiliensis]|uniref:NB-ARC domain-containing protein n=1 Tax=Hevea brasiliensis TaxID=3981 RepID=A0A6A6L005_HEVBR|nr:hypothetical protein GH714_004100 [Hevea brasiliensis]